MKKIVICWDEEETTTSKEKSGTGIADKVMDKSYHDYIGKHGCHFTPELSEHVSKQMQNADGSSHTWSCAETDSAVATILHTNKNKLTKGDYAYLCNMAYADFFPKVLKTETDCIRYACAIAEDKDGTEGAPFRRFLADVIGKGETIDWSKFV